MDTAMMIEIYGYIGSVLVVVSMLMSSIIKLRVINILGSVISGSYALIIGSFPLVLMNSCLIIINVYNLYKLLKAEQKYDLVDSEANDAFVG
ncbi:MAG: YgjV family protein, partial [Lachnospiraceae bacterium]|nr:YgjV family protein [Lachnospiraceae bacterium]